MSGGFHGGGGHMSGGFSGTHMSSGFHGGGHVPSGFSHAPSFGSFSHAPSFGGVSGAHFNSGFSGASHATNHNFAGSATASHFTTPHNFAGNGLAGRSGGGGNFSNAGRNVAGAHSWDWHHGQSWWHPENFRHGFHDFDHFHNFGGVFAGFGFPGWYSLYGWPYYGYGDYGWPYYGDYGSYGYGPGASYYYDYGPSVSNYYDYGPGAGYDVATYSPANPAVYVTPSDATSDQTASTGEDYATQALDAFRSGDYRDALRWASHAAVEMPQDARAHELMSLCLFALKDYRGAAMEAHAALTLGPVIDWPTLYAFYGNVDTYTGQLRALGAFVTDNPKAPEGRFLLAYHFLMTGHKDAAKKELTEVLALAPGDKLAEELLKQL